MLGVASRRPVDEEGVKKGVSVHGGREFKKSTTLGTQAAQLLREILGGEWIQNPSKKGIGREKSRGKGRERTARRKTVLFFRAK